MEETKNVSEVQLRGDPRRRACLWMRYAARSARIRETRTYDQSFDTTWSHLIQFFTSKNVQVKTIEKASGVLYAERSLVDYTNFADCGEPGLALVRGTTATLNVYVAPNGNKSTVTVNTNYSQVRQWDTNIWRVQCTSTGGLESEILNGLTAAAVEYVVPAAPTATVEGANTRVQQAVEFCKGLPLRGVIALDAPPTLEMQSNSGYVTAEEKRALNDYQPLYDQCRDRLMAASPEFRQSLEQAGSRNDGLLNLYERKMTIGDYSRARLDSMEKLRAATSRNATPVRSVAAPAASAIPGTTNVSVPPPASQVTSKVDYCQGQTYSYDCWGKGAH